MAIFNEFGFQGSRGRLVDTQAFALEQLVSIQCATTDLRWAMLELAWRSFTAMCAFAHGRLLARARGYRTPRKDEGRGQHCCC
jgi:hypothetical protein